MNDIINLIPEKWRNHVMLVILISPYATRVIHSLKNGGGIKGALSAIWLGTNTPNKNSVNPSTTEPIKTP
jgi:hypothetical protein